MIIDFFIEKYSILKYIHEYCKIFLHSQIFRLYKDYILWIIESIKNCPMIWILWGFKIFFGFVSQGLVDGIWIIVRTYLRYKMDDWWYSLKRKVVVRLLSGMPFFWVLTGFLMDFSVWMIKEICLMCSSFKSLFGMPGMAYI